MYDVFFSKQGVHVAFFLVGVFLLVYGVFLGGREWYLNVDEIRDYAGSAKAAELYLSNGRWGLALYRSIFPGVAPMNGVLMAGGWICLALVMQGRLLGLRDFFSHCVYGVVALCVTLLGEHMLFANQVDAFGMAIFMSTLAVLLAVERRGVVAKIGSVVLMTWSFAVYQSLVLNVVVLFLGVLYLRGIRNEAVSVWGYWLLMLKVLIPAVLLYAVSSRIAADLPIISANVSEHVAEYQNARFSADAYLSGDVMFTLRLVGHNVLKLLKLMLGLGLPLMCYAACLFGLLGLVQICREREWSISKKLWMLMMPPMILATPYMISVLMNAAAYEAATLRTYSAAPFACAVLCIALFPNGVKCPLLRYGGIWVLVFCVMAAAYDNNNKNKGIQCFYSSLIRDYILIEHEAARASTERGGSDKPRVLLFGSKHITPFNDFSHHPYVNNVHLPTTEEQQAYIETVRELPAWPAPASVHYVAPDTVIVKYR